MVEGSIKQKDIKCMNVHAPYIGAPRYTEQILTDLKRKSERNMPVAEDYNTLTSVDRSSRQKIHKGTVDLNDTLNQIHLMDIYGTFHQKSAKYLFFLSAHAIFSRQIKKTNINKYEKKECDKCHKGSKYNFTLQKQYHLLNQIHGVLI